MPPEYELRAGMEGPCRARLEGPCRARIEAAGLNSFELGGLAAGPDTKLVGLGLSNTHSLVEASNVAATSPSTSYRGSFPAAGGRSVEPLGLAAAAGIFGIEG